MLWPCIYKILLAFSTGINQHCRIQKTLHFSSFYLFLCCFFSFLSFFFFVDKIAPRLHHKATVEIMSKSLLNYNRKKSKIVRKRNIKKNLEAVMRRCSPKKVFLEISQNSQENTSVRVSFLIKFQVSSLQLC